MLKELLQAEHLTQETVAEEAAMHRSTVSRILENPSAANPQMVLRLAEALGLKSTRRLNGFAHRPARLAQLVITANTTK